MRPDWELRFVANMLDGLTRAAKPEIEKHPEDSANAAAARGLYLEWNTAALAIGWALGDEEASQQFLFWLGVEVDSKITKSMDVAARDQAAGENPPTGKET